MNNPRVIRRPPARPAKGEKPSAGKAKWIISFVAVLLVACAAWAFLPSTDPALARIEDLRAQIENAPEGQRRELFGQMREEYQNLRPETREQLRDQMRERWEAREQQRMNEFFAKSPKEQIAQIDKEIDDEIRREKEREKRRAEGGDRRGRGGDAGRGGGGPRGGGGGGPRSRDSLERRKSYLDNSTPEARAQRSEYRRMREERRAQRGLPPSRSRF